MNLDAKRSRFIRDGLSVRLGNLASNLCRLRSFIEMDVADELIKGLIDESEHFVEWTIPEAPLETQEHLVGLQVLLAQWLRGWSRISADPAARRSVATSAQEWSDRVLSMSGLLPQPSAVREKGCP